MREDRKNELLQVLKNNMGVTDFNYYQNLKRIERLCSFVAQQTKPEDRLLNLGSGAFLMECILESNGYTNLTAVDIDNRLAPLYENLKNTGILSHTEYIKKEISDYQSAESYKFITLYDCVYYPGNNIISMLPQLRGLLSEGGFMFFDVYDESVYKYIKFIYDRVRSKYKNRTMYNYKELGIALKQNGFEVVKVNAELGSKGKLAKMTLKLIYFVTGKALLCNYLVRLKPSI